MSRSRSRRSGGRVRFRVADEGLGIPPAEQDRIFEKFFRLDPNLTRGVGGTGLGLYISRELVLRMNGRIWVDSDGRTRLVLLPSSYRSPDAARTDIGRVAATWPMSDQAYRRLVAGAGGRAACRALVVRRWRRRFK